MYNEIMWQVPIAATPEPAKGEAPQLIPQLLYCTTSCDLCQMVPSAAIHSYELSSYQ